MRGSTTSYKKTHYFYFFCTPLSLTNLVPKTKTLHTTHIDYKDKYTTESELLTLTHQMYYFDPQQL